MRKHLPKTLKNGPQTADWIARTAEKWVLYLSTPDVLEDGPNSPVPFLNTAQRLELSQNSYMILYDTEAAALHDFSQVVGDDGPRKNNSYTGPHNVFAYVTGPSGGISENT